MSVTLLYFAHPVNVFGTPLEAELEELIRLAFPFPSMRIENPNQPCHQEGYARWKKLSDAQGHKGMGYYFEEVLPSCAACIALPFIDGKWGRGVAGEAQFFLKKGAPVYVIDPRTKRIFAVTHFLAELLLANDPRAVLSVEETRARTWVSPELYNKEKLSYEKAHLVRFVHGEWTAEHLKVIQNTPKA